VQQGQQPVARGAGVVGVVEAVGARLLLLLLSLRRYWTLMMHPAAGRRRGRRTYQIQMKSHLQKKPVVSYRHCRWAVGSIRF
jgi:hypothetical protein